MKIKMMKKLLFPLLGLIILIAICTFFASSIVGHYINKAIAELPGYSGGISKIGMNLPGGTVDLHDFKLNKVEADSEVPFVLADQAIAGIQWSAIFKGKIVATIDLVNPTLNFAKGKTQKGNQFGTNVDWLTRVQELSPIEINRITVTNGTVRYLDEFSSPKVNLELDKIEAEITNIRNVLDKDNPLPSALELTATTNAGGSAAVNGRFNMLRSIPDANLDIKLENVDVVALNDFLRAYVNVDAERGNLNLYAEMAMREGILNGYLKPLITDLEILDLSEDADQPLQLLWEGLVGMVTTLFENQSKDRIGIKVPLQGDFSAPDAEIIPALASLFRNAFVEALKKQTDGDIDLQSVEE